MESDHVLFSSIRDERGQIGPSARPSQDPAIQSCAGNGAHARKPSSAGATIVRGPSGLDETAAADEMARYGITRVPADQYRYKDYRYSKLGDAIAQARRDEKSS